MDFVKLNNNIIPSMIVENGYQDSFKIKAAVPMSIYDNCQIQDENCFVEKFDSDCDESEDTKGKNCNKARVVVEKLPDSVVQLYLAKKEKNYEKMNFGNSFYNSSGEGLEREERMANSYLRQYLSRKEDFETDTFVKELCNTNMQQYLANTEMGCLANNFMGEISEPLESSVRTHNYTANSLMENLSGNDDIEDPYEIKKNNHYQVMKSLSYSTVEDFNVDVENPMGFIGQKNFSKKKNISRIKCYNIHRRCKKNVTAKLCQRICPNCYLHVQTAHKANEKVKCDSCHVLTLYECNGCKKLAKTYSGISDHLLYRCTARKLHKCAHCKYSVTKKVTLAWHIRKNHEQLILQNLIIQNTDESIRKIINKPYQESDWSNRGENLKLVLKKQKEVKSKSEWYIENVKSSDSKINARIDSSVLVNTSSNLLPKTISNLLPQTTSNLPKIFSSLLSETVSNAPTENSTCSNSMVQLYCEYCNRKIAINAPLDQTEIYCRMCGTVLLFECLICHSTSNSYHSMKDHLKKECTFKENIREKFQCSECNYKSYFQGLVINHQHKIHGFDQSSQFSSDSSILNYSEDY